MNTKHPRRQTFIPVERKTIRDYASLHAHITNAILWWRQGAHLARTEQDDLA